MSHDLPTQHCTAMSMLSCVGTMHSMTITIYIKHSKQVCEIYQKCKNISSYNKALSNQISQLWIVRGYNRTLFETYIELSDVKSTVNSHFKISDLQVGTKEFCS